MKDTNGVQKSHKNVIAKCPDLVVHSLGIQIWSGENRPYTHFSEQPIDRSERCYPSHWIKICLILFSIKFQQVIK